MNDIERLDKQKNILGYICNSVRNFCVDEHRKRVVRTKREEPQEAFVRKPIPGLIQTLEFVLEDITSDPKERIMLTKIAIDNEEPELVFEEMKLSKKERTAFLEKVKDYLVK